MEFTNSVIVASREVPYGPRINSIGEALVWQSRPAADGRSNAFICRSCKHWQIGTVGCLRGMFISYVECSTEGCWSHEPRPKEKKL